jgi:hypothetical protein
MSGARTHAPLPAPDGAEAPSARAELHILLLPYEEFAIVPPVPGFDVRYLLSLCTLICLQRPGEAPPDVDPAVSASTRSSLIEPSS